MKKVYDFNRAVEQKKKRIENKEKYKPSIKSTKEDAKLIVDKSGAMKYSMLSTMI
ncbi:hypothetical protein AB3Z07_09425 [Metabacillus halosaccharovorans]|uniref:hypothetical protein n=1 Tax=Metabacillus halosaccharovorans TaxID=930124 RepID=UPI0034CFAA41